MGWAGVDWIGGWAVRACGSWWCTVRNGWEGAGFSRMLGVGVGVGGYGYGWFGCMLLIDLSVLELVAGR